MKLVASLFFFSVLATSTGSAQENRQSVRSHVLLTCLGICGGSYDRAQANAHQLWRIVEDGNATQLDTFIAEMRDEPVDAQYQIAPKSLSLLNWVIDRGNIKALEFLINKKASLKTLDGRYPLITALGNSLISKRHAMIKLLIGQANANPLKANQKGITALSKAQTINDVVACKIMIASIARRRQKARNMVMHILAQKETLPIEIIEYIVHYAFPQL